MKRGIIIFLAIVSLVFWRCQKIEKVSDIPEIEFKSLTFEKQLDTLGYNTLATIEFSFIDGNADLGVYDEINADSSLPDSMRYGIFINFYEKLNGSYIQRYFVQEIDSFPYLDTLTLNMLLPYDEKLDRTGQNKTVSGIIRAGITLTTSLPYDTMRFEFYIRDRALNKSNVQYTTDFTNSDLDL